MEAAAILEKLDDLGVTTKLDGLDIVFKPIDKIPVELIPDIRANKFQIISLLHGRIYRFRFPEGIPLEVEEQEIVRQVEEIGIVLLWSPVLNDFVAIINTGADRAKAPPGFVIYSNAEIAILVAEDLPERSMRLIHQAKMQGGAVISVQQDETV